jgi:lysophospholipase L1-like esterase
MHHWGGTDFRIKRGQEVWDTYMQGTLNMGCGYDRIENMLWRVYHDELDGFTADNIYMMVGTNNIGNSSEEEILGGIEHLVSAVRARRPEAKVVLMGIFPRVKDFEFTKRLNVGIANLAQRIGVEFREPGLNLLREDGSVDESLFVDGLHPNNEGYSRVVDAFMEEGMKAKLEKQAKKNKKKGNQKK